MSQKTKFSGDFKYISEKQLQFISSVLKEQGFHEANVTFEPVGKAGDNYSSNIKRIVAERNGKELRLIAKIAHNMEQIRQMVNMHEVFCNENTLYKEILPQFTEMEKQAGIPESEQLRYAICYGSLMEPPNEVILLEDLQVSGYVMLDRFTSFTDHDIKLVLNDFAKLHSSSYALKNQKPELYLEYKRKLINLWEVFDTEEMKMFFLKIEEGVLALLDKEEHRSIMKNLISQSPQIVKKLLQTDFDSRFSVIQQGDSWINNIMFQMDGDKTTKCCMVDYQQSRINSPVADLLYMLFNCTDYETRKQHFHEWIEYYHSQLDKRLSEYGLKVNDVYPRDQLDADLKRHGISSMSMSALLASVLMRDSGNAEKIKEMMESGMQLLV